MDRSVAGAACAGQAYLADILVKLVNGWPVQKLDQLLPWAWAEQTGVRLAA